MIHILSRRVHLSFVGIIASVLCASVAHAADSTDHAITIERQPWSFSGFTGHFDHAQLQRGFQVYKEVCSTCHGLKRIAFRNLVEEGGPEFPEANVKALAAKWPNKPLELNDAGEAVERPARMSDGILGPHRNEKQARAAFRGALPPDLSLITKARNVESHASFYVHPFLMLADVATGYQEGGVDYLYALLTGYRDAPADRPVSAGMFYNEAYPGHQIAMLPPLAKDRFVKYQDGSGSLEQNARDVTAFLAWAGDPHLEHRKRLGWQVMLYLLVTAVLIYIAKQRIWAREH